VWQAPVSGQGALQTAISMVTRMDPRQLPFFGPFVPLYALLALHLLATRHSFCLDRSQCFSFHSFPKQYSMYKFPISSSPLSFHFSAEQRPRSVDPSVVLLGLRSLTQTSRYLALNSYCLDVCLSFRQDILQTTESSFHVFSVDTNGFATYPVRYHSYHHRLRQAEAFHRPRTPGGMCRKEALCNSA
jgi:hypothetical protein